MTREEFEYAIKSCGCFIYRGHIYYEESELIKTFEDMGLIEQEPCDHPDKCHECNKILTCTYYKQEPKTGHWIVEVWNNREHHTCSVCQKVVDYEPCYHYCPYCGAKMVDEQESEDKE